VRNRQSRISFFFLGAILLLWPASLPTAQSLSGKIDSQKRQLQEIQNKINRHREKSKELGREEIDVMKQLAHLDKEVSLSQKLVKSLQERETLLAEQIDSLRIDVAYEQHNLEYSRIRLARRLRQMYMRGPQHRWHLLLASPNIQEVVRRYKFVRLVAERDASLVSEVRSRKNHLEAEQATLTEAMADIVALKSTRGAEARRLKQSKKDRVAMLSSIRNEKSKHTQAIDELKRAQKELQNLIDQLERKRLAERDSPLPTGDFARLKGKLMRPVDGTITKKFGQDRHPKFGTVTFNNGVNIKAAPGTPIRAVSAGVVEFVDWIAGYGNCIILNHGGGYYTLYAHVAETFARAGQAVAVREVIAEVGDTGSLNGYECHFEIRKSKEALDPMAWFAK
jgi:septal ring factor EnvC (AmiA/AmiB activator)